MDQGTIVEPDDRRTWTPLRMLLIALGAVAGGILLSIAIGGPARADSASTPPPPAANPDSSLVARVSGALTDLTRAALAPVGDLVATAKPAATGAVPPPAIPTRSATPAPGAMPAALDTALAAVPLPSTPLWQGIVGPQPAQQLVSPLAVVLRPLAPGVADLLAPVLSAPPAAPVAVAIAVSPGSGAAPVVAAPLAHGPGAPPAPTIGTASSPVRHIDQPAPAPRAPLGSTEDAVASFTSGGAMSPAVLVALAAALLLVAAAARRRGWSLPAAPAFGTDISPD